MFAKIRKWKKGQSMTEYAMILVAIAAIASVGYVKFGKGVDKVVTSDSKTIKAIKLPKK
jgi:Flp pilus assembly pilin Flp